MRGSREHASTDHIVADVSNSLSVGAVLRDRYEIIELVGQGGMGAVYKADDLRLHGRVCAVKEVLPELIGAPGMEEQTHDQFYREASTLARLDHPNLPKVSDLLRRERPRVPGDGLRARAVTCASSSKRPAASDTFLRGRAVLGWAVQLCDAL